MGGIVRLRFRSAVGRACAGFQLVEGLALERVLVLLEQPLGFLVDLVGQLTCPPEIGPAPKQPKSITLWRQATAGRGGRSDGGDDESRTRCYR